MVFCGFHDSRDDTSKSDRWLCQGKQESDAFDPSAAVRQKEERKKEAKEPQSEEQEEQEEK